MKPAHARTIKNLLCSTTGRMGEMLYEPPRRFIIVTGGRTGSNLLVSLLRSHPDIRVDSEIFGEYNLADRSVRESINREGAVYYYHRCMRRRGFEKLLGQKFIYYNLERSYGQEHGLPTLADVREVILQDPQLLFIHLKRRDRLARLVSSRLALESGKWTGGSYRGPIQIEVRWAKEELERMTDWEARFDAELPGERTIQMDYESLAEDMGREMARTLAFLGARPLTLETDFKKQNAKDVRECVLNYEQLRRELAGTKHEAIFTGY